MVNNDSTVKTAGTISSVSVFFFSTLVLNVSGLLRRIVQSGVNRIRDGSPPRRRASSSTQGYDGETTGTIIPLDKWRAREKGQRQTEASSPAEWNLRRNNRPVIELNPGTFEPQ